MADREKPMSPEEEALLEEAFAAARAEGPSPELLARVLEDGYAVQDGFTATAPAAPAPRRGILAGLWASIGGAPGLAGLTAATLVGLWFGAYPPEAASEAAAALFGTTDATTATADELLGYDVAFADLLAD